MKLFLCGDVMTGRGIDQILPRPASPELYESYVKNARSYVELAWEVSGEFEFPVTPGYIWGEALSVLEAEAADAVLINLETAITKSGKPDLTKGINYRMSPENIEVLKVAPISACALGNNHVLDWGVEGLSDTLIALRESGILFAGAGRTQKEARAPTVIETSHGRILFFSVAFSSSGVPESWEAGDKKPGVFFFPRVDDLAYKVIKEEILRHKKENDVVVLSIHWGENWGRDVPPLHREFAHRLADEKLIHVLQGHSSHHPMVMEIRNGIPIFYGLGDFINDYEGISGHDEYLKDLCALYFLELDHHGLSAPVRLFCFRRRKLSLVRATHEETAELLRFLGESEEDAPIDYQQVGNSELRVLPKERAHG